MGNEAKQVMNWRVALIQKDIALGQPALNQERLEQAMELAVSASEKPDVLVLPEMWNTGYALAELKQLADPDGRNSRTWLSAFARRHGVHIVGGSVAEQQLGRMYNTMYVFNRLGEEIGRYSKIHLFRLMEEEKHLQPGEQSVIFEMDGIPAGAAICYDIRFPELARTLALKGAKLLFVPAEWPHPRLNHWRTLLAARAIENQMYVIACNRTGRSGNEDFFGHSLIIDPWGQIIAEGGEGEAIVSGVIDLSLVERVRSSIPVFTDRCPAAYEL